MNTSAPSVASVPSHTPGPWTVGDDSPNDYEGPMIDTRDRVVAVITIDHENESTPEERANAQLISAAPDLLAALQAAVEYLEAYRPKGKIRDIFTQLNAHENGALKPARAAIAKATGGQP
jgi:hypothetical protein